MGVIFHTMKIISPSALLVMAAAAPAQDLKWGTLPSLPDPRGLAGPVAGVAHGALLVGGGANFPDKMPWEGGTKVWHDRMWVMEKPGAPWREAGHLPQATGYGVAVSMEEGVVWVGGSNAQGHHAETLLIDWKDGKIDARELPARLPVTCANLCGAAIGRTIYVAGGQVLADSTSALRRFWALDMDHLDKGWQELDPWPGAGRILALAAVVDGSFYLAGGCSLAPGSDGKVTRAYLKDAFCYKPGSGWQELPEMPRAAVAAPSPAPVVGGHAFLVLGGDDGSKVDFLPKEKHPGFPTDILAFDTVQRKWTDAGTVPASRATVPVVCWEGKFIIPNGEARPGVRSPEVHVVEEQKARE